MPPAPPSPALPEPGARTTPGAPSARPDPAPAADDPGGGLPLPELPRLPLRLLLLGALGLQLLSWSILEGYQLADSIEYVENARALVRGHEVLDSHSIRSFFFPLLLAPPLYVADLLGLEDQRWVFLVARAFQVLLGLALVRVSVRLGARLGGWRAGLAAGWVVAVNPVFLQYTVSPLTDVAAALCLGQGLEALVARRDARGSRRSGIWFGLACMVAYKAVLAVLAVLLVLWARDRWKRRRLWLSFLAGVSLCLVAQVVLDRLTYGEWGHSVFKYLGSNFGPLMGKVFWPPGNWLRDHGLEGPGTALMRAGAWFYSLNLDAKAGGGALLHESIRGLFPWHWYVTSLHQWVVAPLLVGFVVGLGRAVARRSWTHAAPLAVILLYVALVSTKGFKDHRLLLPILAPIGAYAGWGWEALAGRGRLRTALALGLLVVGAGLGVDQLLNRNTRKFSGYWSAMEWVNREAAARGADAAHPVTVTSAYHWAVYLREAPGVELTKLPHQLDGWPVLDGRQRREDLFEVLAHEYLIVHLPVLTNAENLELLVAVNHAFAVEAMFWDHEDFEDIGPVFVLRRRSDDARVAPLERHFFDVLEGVDPEAYRDARDLPDPVRFVRPDLGEEVWLMDVQHQVLPGDDHGWLTLTYFCASERILADYLLIQRLTTLDERNSYQRNFVPAWGASRTHEWRRGTLVREGMPVVAAAEPFAWDRPYRPMGGGYRRGDLMPAELYLDFRTQDVDEAGQPFVTGRLEVARPGEDLPIRRGDLAGARSAPGGYRWSLEGLALVRRLFLPVPPDARVPDDGRPIPD